MKAKAADTPALSIQTGNFENRLLLIIRALGGHKSAEKIAGVSTEMLYRYTRGDAQPTFRVASNLALSAGYSLDWLCTGEGPEKRVEGGSLNPGGVDAELLGICISALEGALKDARMTLPVDSKAKVIQALYQLAELDKQAGRPVESPRHQAMTLLKLVS